MTQILELDATGRTVLPQIQHLRNAGPAPLVLLPDGITAHAVVRGDIARQLLNDHRVSRDAQHNWPYYQQRAGRVSGWMLPWVVPSMLNAEGAEHTRLRKLIQRAFTRRSIDALTPAIEAIVDQLIEELAKHPPGATVDLRRDFAYKIPSAVICDLFGVPDELRPTMLAHIDGVIDTSLTPEQAEANFGGLHIAAQALLDIKRNTPGNDLTTRLLQVHETDGDRLSEYELLSTLELMIGAGTETTVALIDNAARSLIRRPAIIEAVRTGDRWDEVIEETLRCYPSLHFLPMRYAKEHIELTDGQAIEKGAAILIGFGAHGRDPAIHETPETWDVDREDKEHLAFGHGIHFCLGAPLARAEARIALSRLFDAFPTMRPAAPLQLLAPVPSFIANDLLTLPVRLAP